MAGFGNEAEFFNAVLVSKEKHGQAPSLAASTKKSNQCLIKARNKARIIQFKNGAKRLLTGSASDWLEDYFEQLSIRPR